MGNRGGFGRGGGGGGIEICINYLLNAWLLCCVSASIVVCRHQGIFNINLPLWQRRDIQDKLFLYPQRDSLSSCQDGFDVFCI